MDSTAAATTTEAPTSLVHALPATSAPVRAAAAAADDDDAAMPEDMFDAAAPGGADSVVQFRPSSGLSKVISSGASKSADGTLVVSSKAVSSLRIARQNFALDTLSERYARMAKSMAEEVVDSEYLDDISMPIGGGITARCMLLRQRVISATKGGSVSLYLSVVLLDTPAECVQSKESGDNYMMIEPSGAVLLPFIGRTHKDHVPPSWWKTYTGGLKAAAAAKVTHWSRTVGAVRLTDATTFDASLYNGALLKNPLTGELATEGDVVTLSGLRFTFTDGDKSARANITRASVEREPSALVRVYQRLRSSPNVVSMNFAEGLASASFTGPYPWTFEDDGTMVLRPEMTPKDALFNGPLYKYPVREINPLFFVLPLGTHAVDINRKQNELITVVGEPLVMTEVDEHFVGEKMVNNAPVQTARARFTVPVSQSRIDDVDDDDDNDKPPMRMDVSITLREEMVEMFGTDGDCARLVSSVLPNAVGVMVVAPIESCKKQWGDERPNTQAYCERLIVGPTLASTLARSSFEVPLVVLKHIIKSNKKPGKTLIEQPHVVNKTPQYGVMCLTRTKYLYDEATLDELHASGRWSYHVLTRRVVTPEFRAERDALRAAGVSVARVNSTLLFGANPLTGVTIPPLHAEITQPLSKWPNPAFTVFAIDNEALKRSEDLVNFADVPLASDVVAAMSVDAASAAAAAALPVPATTTTASGKRLALEPPVPASKRRGSASSTAAVQTAPTEEID
jgi:hypothetical protein